MATVIGDRDILLLGSSQRALNPVNSGILLTTSAPAFKVDTSGNPLPTTITVKANLIGIAGTVAFTASGATVADNHDNTATLAFSSLTGASCTVTAAITVNSQAFSSSVTLAKVTDGAVGGNGANGNQYATVFLYQWSASTPLKPNGTSGYTWSTGVNSTYTGTDQWQINPSNPGTPGFQLYVAAAQITAAGGTTSSTVSYTNSVVQVWSQNGANGISAVTGLLTNEATTFAATSAGVVSDFSPAGGTFKVFSGSTDVTGASVTYSVVSQSGCTVSIAATGVYSVSAMSANQAFATFQAVYGGVTIQKIISLAKSIAGATGTAAYVVVSATGQVFSRANSAGSFAPTSQTLTATPYGGTATYQWQYWTGSAWTNVASSGTSSTYTVNSGDFTDARTYRVQATISGTVYTDQITLMQVTGGTNGTNGIQSTYIQVYRWDSSTAPAAPAGSLTYTWSTGDFGAAPTSPTTWQLSPGVAPGQGMTLWAARLRITDVSTNTTTNSNWSSSVIIAVGSSGSNGTAGAAGASYVTAYCASSTASTTTAPSATTGKTSLPATNSGGITGTWSATVPSLTSGQYLYQSDGIYDPTTNQVTWSIPYWSSLKVGSLSAITVNTGNLTVSGTISDSGGNWSLDSNGNMTANSAALKGNIKGGSFTAYAWPASGTGYYLGPEGLLLGNANTSSYLQVTAAGNIIAPQFTVTGGSATFSGTLAAGTVMSQNLSSLSATIGTLRTASSGARIEISDNLIVGYNTSNTMRFKISS
jgi:hypothetical protein